MGGELVAGQGEGDAMQKGNKQSNDNLLYGSNPQHERENRVSGCSPELMGWLSLPARLAAGISGSTVLQGDEAEAGVAGAVGGSSGSCVLGLR